MCLACTIFQHHVPRPDIIGCRAPLACSRIMLRSGKNLRQTNPDEYIQDLMQWEGQFLHLSDAIENAFVAFEMYFFFDIQWSYQKNSAGRMPAGHRTAAQP